MMSCFVGYGMAPDFWATLTRFHLCSCARHHGTKQHLSTDDASAKAGVPPQTRVQTNDRQSHVSPARGHGGTHSARMYEASTPGARAGHAEHMRSAHSPVSHPRSTGREQKNSKYLKTCRHCAPRATDARPSVTTASWRRRGEQSRVTTPNHLATASARPHYRPSTPMRPGWVVGLPKFFRKYF
jgi:hypothetical protein